MQTMAMHGLEHRSGMRCKSLDAPTACRFAALAHALNAAGQAGELVELVEAGKHALNDAAAAEFLHAMGATGRLSEYARGAPVR